MATSCQSQRNKDPDKIESEEETNWQASHPKGQRKKGHRKHPEMEN